VQFRILHYETLDSTNNLAITLARDGAAEGTVILSDYQTHGRGRFKRCWISPRGKGLLFSVITRPKLKRSHSAILTHLAAKSVTEVLERRHRLPARIKKPNDVLVRGAKIAGILAESSGYPDRLDYVVIGIGLNVNTPRQSLFKGATSICLETGRQTGISELLCEILLNFEEKYSELTKENLRKGVGVAVAQGI
jgi:BirA family biotin operon repressor/biotin-[acetyl-CoA-carboxylase] ligase